VSKAGDLNRLLSQKWQIFGEAVTAYNKAAKKAIEAANIGDEEKLAAIAAIDAISPFWLSDWEPYPVIYERKHQQFVS